MYRYEQINLDGKYREAWAFAHNLNEQKKDINREFIYDMIYKLTDLSNTNINENKELFEELMIFTKECKNCINEVCQGCTCDFSHGRSK